MASVIYNQTIGSTVFAITPCGIDSGSVILVKINLFDLTTEIQYCLQKIDGSLLTSSEADTFTTLAEAIAEYQVRLT